MCSQLQGFLVQCHFLALLNESLHKGNSGEHKLDGTNSKVTQHRVTLDVWGQCKQLCCKPRCEKEKIYMCHPALIKCVNGCCVAAWSQ